MRWWVGRHSNSQKVNQQLWERLRQYPVGLESLGVDPSATTFLVRLPTLFRMHLLNFGVTKNQKLRAINELRRSIRVSTIHGTRVASHRSAHINPHLSCRGWKRRGLGDRRGQVPHACPC